MTGSAAARRLAGALRDESVGELVAIDDHQVDQLLGLVDTERQRRAASLTDAVEHGLEMVPKPLRGVVKKLVFPR